MQPEPVEITIPAVPEGHLGRSWRKALMKLDTDQHGGEQILGAWLEANASYRVTPGVLILTDDLRESGTAQRRDGSEYTVCSATLTVYLVDPGTDGGLTLLWTRTFSSTKTSFGPASIKKLSGLLARHAAPARAQAQLVREAPLEPNSRADTCNGCRGPVAADEGVLRRCKDGKRRPYHTDCDGTDDRAKRARREAEAKAAAERAARPRRNAYEQECSRCGQIVPADEGLLTGSTGVWSVTHDGPCPQPEPQQSEKQSAADYVIHVGVPGRGRGRPGRYWADGQVLRAKVYGAQIPEDAPGLRRAHFALPSAIVVVVRELKAQFLRDEDGDQPSELIGEDGWYHTAEVRIATPEEAAPILEREQHAERGRVLDARRRGILSEFDPAPDGTRPAEVKLSGAQRVPIGIEDYFAGDGMVWVDRLYADAEHAYAMRYNGMDGDDWSLTNGGVDGLAMSITVYPLTEERAQLIAQLREYHGKDTAKR